MLKKISKTDLLIVIFLVIFVLSLGYSILLRGGRDLNIFLYGAYQAERGQSPYDNPTDMTRPLYRYAPGFLIFQKPYLLNSTPVRPFWFKDIEASAMAWYVTELLALFFSLLLLRRLMPSVSKQKSFLNLKISFFMALPLIAYELSNSQSKIVALFFLLAALVLFEENRIFLSTIAFQIALTIYIPFIFFLFYFVIRYKKGFLFSFILSFLIIFIVLPSLAFGFRFNLFLLKEWFRTCIQPFSLARDYLSYADLRDSSQSLPSAIGRMFTFDDSRHLWYLVSPVFIHKFIRVFTYVIVLLSCGALFKSRKISRSWGYVIFLLLALILPQYVLLYTWAWLFVVYFAVLNHLQDPSVPVKQKKILIGLTGFLALASYMLFIPALLYVSLLFWATFIFWAAMVLVLWSETRMKKPLQGPGTGKGVLLYNAT